MKKEENQKKNVAPKNDKDFRSRSHSPKAYLGCDTCKLRKNKSNSKLSDYGVVQDKNKIKKITSEKAQNEGGHKTKNIRLTDLCDEDKKRIVELIEELSKLAEKNQQLKESVDLLQKEKQEQQEYIMRQAHLHLEEKNIHVNEVNEFRNRIEMLENQIRKGPNLSEWQNRERCKIKDINYLTNALQKSLKEKNQLRQQMDHLRICLKHSLESFQRLRAEISELQRQELTKKQKTVSSQTENKLNSTKEKHKVQDLEDTEEEEFLSTCNQDSVNAKSSLDIINDKLEYVYQMLKKRGESLSKGVLQKHSIDLSTFTINEKVAKELEAEEFSTGIQELINEGKPPIEDCEENDCKFQKPFEKCSKTSVQAERILKKFGKPLNLNVNECTKKTDNKTSSCKYKESARDLIKHCSFLRNKIVQKNTLFKLSEDQQYDEERLLEELFYPELNSNFGVEDVLRPEFTDVKNTFDERPFTW